TLERLGELLRSAGALREPPSRDLANFEPIVLEQVHHRADAIGTEQAFCALDLRDDRVDRATIHGRNDFRVAATFSCERRYCCTQYEGDRGKLFRDLHMLLLVPRLLVSSDP